MQGNRLSQAGCGYRFGATRHASTMFALPVGVDLRHTNGARTITGSDSRVFVSEENAILDISATRYRLAGSATGELPIDFTLSMAA